MNNGPLLFFGILATMASSFWGMILLPQIQIGRQQAVVIEETGAYYPPLRAGQASQGAEVYRSLGCAECHSQQVRGIGGDRARSWGRRISVAQDYLHDQPVQLGVMRIGPDLANVGARRPDANSLYAHLWDPRLAMPGSIMPRYPFLFEKRLLAAGEKPAAAAVQFARLPEGHEIMPTPEARQLVAYLMSLRADNELFEAPFATSATKAVAEAKSATTNAPAAAPAATNSPAPAK
jgi:cytochrome c oxidase cbb3-type subunit 2